MNHRTSTWVHKNLKEHYGKTYLDDLFWLSSFRTDVKDKSQQYTTIHLIFLAEPLARITDAQYLIHGRFVVISENGSTKYTSP